MQLFHYIKTFGRDAVKVVFENSTKENNFLNLIYLTACVVITENTTIPDGEGNSSNLRNETNSLTLINLN